jgi:hypothetical protein
MLRPMSPERIAAIVDDLFLPLVAASQSQSQGQSESLRA